MAVQGGIAMWNIIALSVLFSMCVIVTFIIWRQPESKTKLSFKVSPHLTEYQDVVTPNKISCLRGTVDLLFIVLVSYKSWLLIIKHKKPNTVFCYYVVKWHSAYLNIFRIY